AIDKLVDVIPATFRTDWAMALRRDHGEVVVLRQTSTAPEIVPESASWVGIRKTRKLPELDAWDSTVLAASPGKDRAGKRFVVVVGRHGGPEILDSELARLAHMVSLAASVQTV
ncbi:MAG: hypothetical protein ACXWDH_07395, partial [Aeromicrobium sp.]